jgi:general secretion pathway protein I
MKKNERGFTLLEAIVAFAIAALALGILFRAATGGIVAVATAGRYEEAVSRAKSHMAAIGHDGPLGETQTEGDDGGGFHWRIRIVPLASANAGGNQPAPFLQPASRKPTLFSVEVGISWTEGGRHREFLLQSQRLGAPGGETDG